MAKRKSSKKGRSQSKILDAFQIAERAENRGKDSDEEYDSDLHVRDGIMDARKFLKNRDDNDKLEDEDLDSDEALGSDDDYDVLNSKFSQTIRDKRKKKIQKERKAARGESASSESESEYDSIDESQLVTLSEAWDMDEKDLAITRKTSKDVVLDDAWDTASEQEEELGDSEEAGEDSGSEGDSESGSESEASESEDDEAMLRGSDTEDVNLSSTISQLQSQIKTPAKRKWLVSETVEENEFSVPTRGNTLSLAEMMAAADGKEALIDEDEAKPLAVPLPKRIQQRHDRTVAYGITKEEVSKWEDTVRAIQEADNLEFPLAPPASKEEQEEVDAEEEYDALRFVPEAPATSELESKITGLLKAGALLDESKEATFQQIESAKLSKEEMFSRTQELRRMRELMFRDEQRAKRIKKIKSKQFRKIHKKERLRNAELVEGSDEGSDPEDHDMKRAEERMSLRHKTQSQWAKSMIKSGISKDASSRAELEEMLRAGERLRTKQLGYQEGDQSDDNISDIEKEYDNDKSDDEARAKLGKGVMAMDFMKAAEERKRKENLREIEAVRNMGNGTHEFESEKNSINRVKNQGRRVYSPTVAAEKEVMEDLEEETLRDFRDDEAKSLQNRMRGRTDSDDEAEPATKKHKVEQESVEQESEFEGFASSDDDEPEEDAGDNPWMAGDDKPVRSKKFSAVTEESSKLSKAANKISKHASKKSSSKAKESDTYINMDDVLLVGNSGNAFASDDEEEDTGNRMFRQQNLIQEAFAGDDVMAEFQDEKRQVEVDEDDKEKDLTLPGWGDWAGSDRPQKPRKKFVQKIDGVVQKDKRKDKGKQNVIINETANKHNLKYRTSNVPYPYESKEQYERALRMPLGEEWSSRATHQKSTLPRVIVKQGMVVDPLKAPFK